MASGETLSCREVLEEWTTLELSGSWENALWKLLDVAAQCTPLAHLYLVRSVTPSCNSRSVSLEALTWAILCKHAFEMLLQNPAPALKQQSDNYEARFLEETVADVIRAIFDKFTIAYVENEHEYRLGLKKGNKQLCAIFTGLVYTLNVKGSLVTLHIEQVAKLDKARLLKTLVKGLALYYERRLPVWIIIISQNTIKFKILSDKDRENMLDRLHEKPPPPGTCNICDLASFCPHKSI